VPSPQTALLSYGYENNTLYLLYESVQISSYTIKAITVTLLHCACPPTPEIPHSPESLENALKNSLGKLFSEFPRLHIGISTTLLHDYTSLPQNHNYIGVKRGGGGFVLGSGKFRFWLELHIVLPSANLIKTI